MSENSTITFRLPTAFREKIKEQAKAEERSEGAFIRFHLGKMFSLGEDEIGLADEDESQTERGEA